MRQLLIEAAQCVTIATILGIPFFYFFAYVLQP